MKKHSADVNPVAIEKSKDFPMVVQSCPALYEDMYLYDRQATRLAENGDDYRYMLRYSMAATEDWLASTSKYKKFK